MWKHIKLSMGRRKIFTSKTHLILKIWQAKTSLKFSFRSVPDQSPNIQIILKNHWAVSSTKPVPPLHYQCCFWENDSLVTDMHNTLRLLSTYFSLKHFLQMSALLKMPLFPFSWQNTYNKVQLHSRLVSWEDSVKSLLWMWLDGEAQGESAA